MYVDTKIASIIYGVTQRALQNAFIRKSPRYKYQYQRGIGRGGRKLLVWIDDEHLEHAIKSGKLERESIATAREYSPIPEPTQGEPLSSQELKALQTQESNITKEDKDEIPNKIRTAESLGEVSKVSQANDDQADRGHRGDYERRVSGGEVEYERLYRASPQKNDDLSKRAGGVYSSNHKGIQALESQSSTPPLTSP